MHPRHSLSRLKATLGILAASCTLVAGQSVSSPGTLPGHTPRFVTASTTKNLGAENPATVVDVSLWLNIHNRTGIDALYKEVYNPSSSSYRKWLTKTEFASKFAPTAAEAAQVSSYLTAHGLKVLSVGPDNMFVRAQGTVGEVSKAFHVTLNRYQVKNKVIRANSSDPVIEGPTAALIQSVAGLDNAGMTHPLATSTPKNLTAPKAKSAPVSVDAASVGISPDCFLGPATETISPAGVYPLAVLHGNKYNASSTGCGYTPAEIRTAYNLNSLYKEGYDGTGQSIVIIDWCGSPTILADANAFSAKFGLPPLITGKNFQIVNYPGPSYCAGPDAEINIDVEWAHAIAPGASITLLVPPSAQFSDINAAEYYAINNGLGNIISGSYGAEELDIPVALLINNDLLNEIAAVYGVAVNFSTGDYGDFTFDAPEFNPPSVSTPADSPYATAVGGVSLALKPDNSIKWQTGWGTNLNLLVAQGPAINPPSEGFFNFGSGGGPSALFLKPAYQDSLPGRYRQLPDISWLGDPYTGAIIVISQPFTYPAQVEEVYGGTSLACPMFAALWAIANQEAGTDLGQAAPYLYSMPKGKITDVVAVGSPTDVSDWIYTSPTHIIKYSPTYIAEPLENTTEFYSAFWDFPDQPFVTYLITFGTDSGLTVHGGWDNVTGLGTPNGKAFADYFNPGK